MGGMLSYEKIGCTLINMLCPPLAVIPSLLEVSAQKTSFGCSTIKLLKRLILLATADFTLRLAAGVGIDVLINTLLFIAGVIPGHIHGFYVTWTYFWKKRKVAKGRYPGSRKSFIYSERVWNGDASNAHVRELWEAEQQKELIRKRSKSQRSKRGQTAGWRG